MLKAVIIGLLVPFIIMSFIPRRKWPNPKPKHRFKSRSQSSPKTLPWFDKNYLKRKREEEYRRTGIDI